MNILELDEAQGLTAEMVRAWLRKSGIKLDNDLWVWNSEEISLDKQGPVIDDISFTINLPLSMMVLGAIAFAWRSISRQALLRDINPRMRKGLPSLAAIAAHDDGDGLWFAQEPGGDTLTVAMDSEGQGVHAGPRGAIPAGDVKNWSFWPCDQHLNKVRWPTDADGRML